MEDKEFWKNERVAFLALASLKGVGFWSLHKIAQSKAGFKEVLKYPQGFGIEKNLSAAGFSDSGQEALWAEGLTSARTLAGQGIRLLFKQEPDFPQKLKDIHDAPEWIFVQGAIDNLSKPAVAVVGTRKPSEDGLFLTKYALACLAGVGCVTISGLALGIDQMAHVESIRYQLPTVAILGTGILQNYPKGSETLRDKILAAGGTIITEYLPHQSYSAESFVRRNRLQAALGDALMPIEWSIKSGTAHTVKYAEKYGKAIINLYLPSTFSSRPELLFSSSEYGATMIEVPAETDTLVKIIKARVMGWWDEGLQVSVADIEANVVVEDTVKESKSVEEDNADGFGQLPLI